MPGDEEGGGDEDGGVGADDHADNEDESEVFGRWPTKKVKGEEH